MDRSFAVEGRFAALPRSVAEALDSIGSEVRSVVLVEGLSDKAAVETAAKRLGRDLEVDGVAVMSMAGVTNIVYFLEALGPQGLNFHLAGLCDGGEESEFRRALKRAGMGDFGERSGMESAGFFVCDEDLEDELIRALGVDKVNRIIAEEGEAAPLRRFRAQPAQRDRSLAAQLRRFLGTRSGRKIRYGEVLVAALEPDRIPRPLLGVLAVADNGSAKP